MKLPVINEGWTPLTEEQETEVAGLLGMPGVVCNNCPAAESCPKREDNATCYYEEQFHGLSSRNVDNHIVAMQVIADIQWARAMRAYYYEMRTTGGMVDANVTRQLEVAANARQRAYALMAPVVQEASRSVAIIATEKGGAAAEGGGLVARLMAGLTGAVPQSGGELTLTDGRSDRSAVLDAHAEIIPS